MVGTVLPSLHSEIIDVVEGDEPVIDGAYSIRTCAGRFTIGNLPAEAQADTANVAARGRLRAIGIDC